MIKKIAAAAAMLSMTAAGGFALASPAWAVPAEQRACDLYANVVTQAGNTLVAHGGRVGCGVPATVTVQLNKDISMWPDSTLAAETVTGRVVHLAPRGSAKSAACITPTRLATPETLVKVCTTSSAEFESLGVGNHPEGFGAAERNAG
ncbi:hypothetical protein [Saccharopolyspora phatthalungensis]|uniref:Secreted protein n=1 Tax=Saccharopolyspora phatthalungensis TaxID=664693 RepID=A0A840Q3P0_9PSEU|nr:hypothetical protein [Saccharopolyspora phatthalungensis]MBB5157122.1 hypothetical protein [Saccharopolyspora phatthalungensis]